MIIISDRILKFLNFFLRGVTASGITFFPFIIFASNIEIDDELINHERIHLRQQLELLIIPFYIWYFIEYYTKGYWQVSFEKEAYANDKNPNYLKERKMFSFFKYIFKTL
jgi:hypothetical protein